MNNLYILYVRFMMWLGAAPPEGHETLLQEIPLSLSDKDNSSRKFFQKPLLVTIVKIVGGWGVSLVISIITGFIITLIVGIAFGLGFSIFAFMEFISEGHLPDAIEQFHHYSRDGWLVGVGYILIGIIAMIGIFIFFFIILVGLPIGLVSTVVIFMILGLNSRLLIRKYIQS
ncbi:hypothetical protein ACFLXQ_06930 [Chloroflexota bacterium]